MSEVETSGAPSNEEVSLAMRRCWQPVARVQDLRSGPRRAVLMGEALTVFLTESGEPAVVGDRCVHRGASLSMGVAVGDCIQCPYHGWEWDGHSGACTRIPALPDQRQIPPQARIPAYPVREQWGLVWTVLEQPQGEPPNAPWFDPEEWTTAHGEPFELPVAIGVAIENFRDVAHFAFVHKATMGEVAEVVEPLPVQRDGLVVTMRREMRMGPGGDGNWDSLREGFNYAVAPNLTTIRLFMEKGERCLLHAARAVSATESVHYWLVGVSEDYGRTVEEAIEIEESVYAEDREVMETIEPPELPLGDDADVSTLADRFTLAYRAAFSQFVREALAGRPASRRGLSRA
jgi:phenylpropionate dioxygenase-like ring-hydroxylating dioxygenase large terminal subunit